MKVKVIRQFLDKFNLARTFNPGEVVDFEEKRAKDIISRGLGEPFEEKEKREPKAAADEAPVASPAPKVEENTEVESPSAEAEVKPEVKPERKPRKPRQKKTE